MSRSSLLFLSCVFAAACTGADTPPDDRGGDDDDVTCTTPACADDDGDGVPASDDCDDTMQTGAACSTGCLEFFVDADGDGYGLASSAVTACAAPVDYIADDGDCNDDDDAHWSDCNHCFDRDGDLHGTGCDLGNDCDDTLESGAACTTACVEVYRDVDGDGVGAGVASTHCSGAAGYTLTGTDCDESNESGNTCSTGCVEVHLDGDGDGYGASDTFLRCSLTAGLVANDDDCDDSSSTGETCHDGCTAYYRDTDGDGFGDSSQVAQRCSAPANYVAQAGDCNVSSPSHWSDCAACVDDDHDDHGDSCDIGEDCDDDDEDNWLSCQRCLDYDGDGSFSGCDSYAHHVGPDCDDGDPTVHPGAIDFPDSGFAEDCVANEPSAASGNGIYVDVNAAACTGGGTPNGSKASPFCSLSAALEQAPTGGTIFVAAGTYGLPTVVRDVNIFGGYAAPAWSRDITANPTVLASSRDFFGGLFGNVLLQGVSFEYDSDCDNCTAMASTEGGMTLVDTTVGYSSSANLCNSIYANQGDATLVRVTVEGAACSSHVAVLANSNTHVRVWDSELRGGTVGGVTGQQTGVAGSGNVLVANTLVLVDGESATGVWTYAPGTTTLLNAVIVATAVDAAEAAKVSSASLVAENCLFRANSEAAATGVHVTSDSIALRHNNIDVGTCEAPVGVRISTTTTASIANNGLYVGAATSATAQGVFIENGLVSLFNNSLASSGAGFCPVSIPGQCISAFDSGDPSINQGGWQGYASGGGNFAAACDADEIGHLASDSPCVGAGYDLSATMLFPIDFQGQARPSNGSWDVGRDEYVQLD